MSHRSSIRTHTPLVPTAREWGTPQRVAKLQTLEALRGIAALLVVLYHLQDIFSARAGVIPFGGLFGSGDRGVDLFFVLSGFIIMATHARDIGRPGSVRLYFYKRFCRIFPSVWILTALAAAIYACQFGGTAKASKLDPWNIIASALLLPQNGPPLVNVTWTLTYEIFFYVLFAVLLLNRRLGMLVLLTWQAAIALTAVNLLHCDTPIVAYYLRPICLEFGIGMTCAWLIMHHSCERLIGKHAQLVLLTLGSGTFVGGLLYEAIWQAQALSSTRFLVFGLGSAAIIVAMTLLERAGRIRVFSPLVWLGGASYAIYLVHYSVITLLAIAVLRLQVLPPTTLVLLACAIIGIAAGGAFHTYVDQPIQGLLRRLAQRGHDVLADDAKPVAIANVYNGLMP